MKVNDVLEEKYTPVVDGFDLLTCASVCSGQMKGDNVVCKGIAIDSRKVRPGNLFVAIKGEFVDGHDYLKAAKEKGARAALVTHFCDVDLPQILVADQQLALHHLAKFWRDNHPIPIVGITGSCGKTSMKEMVAKILANQHTILHTTGNLNNELGVPMTVLGIDDEEFAVVEMGACKKGDIQYLCDMVQPDIGIITAIAPVHLEGFKDINGVLQGKTELFESVANAKEHTQRLGIVVLNIDDENLASMANQIETQMITYGLEQGDCHCISYKEEGDVILAKVTTPIGQFDLQLQLLGKHNLLNALGATACGIACGLSLENIASGLSEVKPVGGRLYKRTSAFGFTLIDDTYNANPVAFKAAIDVLVSDAHKHTMVVMGDMGELGDKKEFYHAQIGQYAKEKGVERFYAVGPLSKNAVEAFGGPYARHFDTQASLILALLNLPNQDYHFTDNLTVLIKGSRSAKMEKVVQALMEGNN